MKENMCFKSSFIKDITMYTISKLMLCLSLFAMIISVPCVASEKIDVSQNLYEGGDMYTHIFITSLLSRNNVQPLVEDEPISRELNMSILYFKVDTIVKGDVDDEILFDPRGVLYRDIRYWAANDSPIFLETNRRYLVMLRTSVDKITALNDTEFDLIRIIDIDETLYKAKLRDLLLNMSNETEDVSSNSTVERIGGACLFPIDEFPRLKTDFESSIENGVLLIDDIILRLGRPLFGWHGQAESVLVYSFYPKNVISVVDTKQLDRFSPEIVNSFKKFNPLWLFLWYQPSGLVINMKTDYRPKTIFVSPPYTIND